MNEQLTAIIETFEQASGLTFDELLNSEEWLPLLCEEVGREVLGLNDNIKQPNT
jgi:hypothetical protein